MPRLARKNLESSFLHIIVQGINRSYIFQDNTLKSTYKSILKRNLEETNVKILAYCIMDNHAHILMHSDNSNEISQIMKKTNTSYAMLYNKINKRVGYVFRNRYYVQMILSNRQLYNCISYIHKNPIKAGIVKNLSEYKYSSYIEYLHKKDLVTPEGIKLALGSDKNYFDIFHEIHKLEDNEDIKDIIEEYETPDAVIQEYLKETSMTLENIKTNKQLLAKLLLRLRHSAGLSLRSMEKLLDINKDTLCKIINKHIK